MKKHTENCQKINKKKTVKFASEAKKIKKVFEILDLPPFRTKT